MSLGQTIRHLATKRMRRLTRDEFTTLAGYLIVIAILFAVLGLAGEVLEGETLPFDRAILLGLRNPANLSDPIGPRWLEEMARDVTGMGSNLILTVITLAVAGYFLLLRQRAAAWLVLASVGGGTALSFMLKLIVHRSRPDLVPHAVEVYTASFPSGHAMLSAVTYLTLGALLARVQPRWRVKIYIMSLAILATLLIGVSRIYLGVHWPTDVLAGWCLGIAWALLCWLATLGLQRAGRLSSFDPTPGA